LSLALVYQQEQQSTMFTDLCGLLSFKTNIMNTIPQDFLKQLSPEVLQTIRFELLVKQAKLILLPEFTNRINKTTASIWDDIQQLTAYIVQIEEQQKG
jgi:hypothetical protein